MVAALTTMPTGGVVGGSMLAGLGAAVARGQQWWGAVAAGLSLAVALDMGRQSGHPLAAVLLVAAFGVVPFAVGYVLAAPRRATP